MEYDPRICDGPGSARAVSQINLNSYRSRAVAEKIMGLGGLHVWHLLILLVVVLLVFGTKKLKNVGQDLGDAVKGFRSAMAGSEKGDAASEPKQVEESAPRRADAPAPTPTASKSGAAGDRRAQVVGRQFPVFDAVLQREQGAVERAHGGRIGKVD